MPRKPNDPPVYSLVALLAATLLAGAAARLAAGVLSGRGSAPIGGSLHRGDIDLLHLEHRLHGAPGSARIGVLQQRDQLPGDDLPGQAEPVLEPAALARRAAVRGQRVPIIIDLGLVLAVDGEGNRLGELEVGAAVEADIGSAGERESTVSTSPADPLG
jgi:hypothetical protein